MSKGIIDFARFGKKNGLLVATERSRIGNFKKTNDAFPGGVLADEILTPGQGQIKALFVTGGNPLMTMADADKLTRAFAELELLVTLDIQPSETAQSGHYMLPCVSPLERPDLPFIFPLMLGLQTKPYLQATEALLEAPGEARDEATIYTDLAAACGKPLFGSRVFQWLVQLSRRLSPGQGVAQRGMLGLILRLCGEGGFGRLARSVHGRLRPDHAPDSFLGQRVYTDDSKVQLAPPELLARAQQALHDLVQCGDTDPAYPYRLITKRAVTTHNSWTHNYAPFLRGDNDRNYLYMHSQDLAAEGLETGDWTDIASATGLIQLQVKALDDLMPGVVAVPHGWGHGASGLSVARQTRGANVNVLHPSGPEHVDPVSGMSTLTAVPVRVQRSNAAPDVRSAQPSA